MATEMQQILFMHNLVVAIGLIAVILAVATAVSNYHRKRESELGKQIRKIDNTCKQYLETVFKDQTEIDLKTAIDNAATYCENEIGFSKPFSVKASLITSCSDFDHKKYYIKDGKIMKRKEKSIFKKLFKSAPTKDV